MSNYTTSTFQETEVSKTIFNAGIEASIEYAEPNSAVSPNIRLLFSPFGLPYVPIEIVGTNINQIITNLEWNKDRNNPGGILQVSITPNKKVIEGMVDLINKLSANLYSTIWGELGVDLEDLFKPMTLCQLWINNYHVMTGYVRACQRSTSMTNEDKELSYSLIIEELGNMYNLSTTSLDLILEDGLQSQINDSMKKALSTSATLKGIPVSSGIQAVLNAFLSTTLTEKMSLSDGFSTAFRLLATPSPYGGIANFPIGAYMTLDTSMFELNSGSGSQSVWSLLQSFIPNPWMELFTESGGRTMVVDGLAPPAVLFPGFNHVVSRTTPYSNPLIGSVNELYRTQTLLFDLTVIQMLTGGDFIIITDEIISDKSLGFDSVNQSTVFRTTYTNRGVTNMPDARDRNIKSSGPLNPFASGGVSTFGIREMNQTIDCTSLIGLGVETSYVERIAKNMYGIPGLALTKSHLNNLLATWFRNQSRFREGTVTSKCIPYARAGMYCLYLPTLSGKKVENLRDIGLYYIDSLSHSYSVENEDMTFETTLNLIRGVPLPTTLAQSALLLFDFEVLPPASGLYDGEFSILRDLRASAKFK